MERTIKHLLGIIIVTVIFFTTPTTLLNLDYDGGVGYKIFCYIIFLICLDVVPYFASLLPPFLKKDFSLLSVALLVFCSLAFILEALNYSFVARILMGMVINMFIHCFPIEQDGHG